MKPPEVRTNVPGVAKEDPPHQIATCTRELLAKEYADDFKIFTDGSVLSDGRTGAGLFFETTREHFEVKLPPTTILTAELVAIREALNKVKTLPRSPTQIVILSDSQSSLNVIQSEYCKTRPEILKEILILSEEIARRRLRLRFQWVPSHVGIHGNEMADRAAKRGALTSEEDCISLCFSTSDANKKIDQATWELWSEEYAGTAATRGWPIKTCNKGTLWTHPHPLPTHILHLISRIRVNHWKTRYLKTVCACGTELVSFLHCLFLCPILRNHFQPLLNLLGKSPPRMLYSITDHHSIIMAAHLISTSPVGHLL
ncbi:uncharacterized protein LOC143041338 [Oratosquilla oratoria]|uniref:uncharacterized protein LOC143041338 n=1 Tax=Oratosquilla oratoria TaxID=337810 RepID=UPI003F76FC07